MDWPSPTWRLRAHEALPLAVGILVEIGLIAVVPNLFGPSDLAYVLAYFTVIMVLTTAATLAASAAVKKRALLAAAVGSLFVPALLIGYAVFILTTYPDGPPPNDAKAMAAMFLFIVALVSFPLTLGTSLTIVRRRNRAINGS